MLAADMGGMGFIENNKALCMLTVLTSTHMLQAAQQHGVERYFYSSSACVYAADKQTDTAHHRAEGVRRLPGDARGRLRLGEAVHRADVPALPRGLRPADPGGPLPQRLRPARHLDRRPGEGAGGGLPQDRHRRDHRQPRDRHLGRRRADPQLHVHRRLRARLADDPQAATAPSRSTSAATSWSASTSCTRSSRRSPASRAPATTSSTRPRACAAATATTPRSARPTAGRPSTPLADGMAQTYAWVYDEVKRSLG